MAKTLYDKIWDAHLVASPPGETPVLYIDRHLVHEVTSPQAFEGLRLAGRKVRRPELTLAVADHNVPTKDRDKGITEPESRLQVETLEKNAKDFGIEYFPMDDIRQGIVHIIGPEQGWTLPGTTIVCGDSHTSTHGAFGALAFGIGTSEVEHVLATQTLRAQHSKNMRVTVNGKLPDGVTAKDIALAVIAKIGTAGGTGYVIEYAGEAVRALSMEGRMTLCNLTIEGGARAGLIAVDDTTFNYVKGKPRAPKAGAWEARGDVLAHPDSPTPTPVFDAEVVLDARDIVPMVTWGTSPEQALPITANVPDPAADEGRTSPRRRRARAGLYGPDRQHADHRHQGRPCLHRLLHQWPHRGSARRRRDRQGPEGRRRRQRHRGAGLGPGEGAGGRRRPGQGVRRGRL